MERARIHDERVCVADVLVVAGDARSRNRGGSNHGQNDAGGGWRKVGRRGPGCRRDKQCRGRPGLDAREQEQERGWGLGGLGGGVD